MVTTDTLQVNKIQARQFYEAAKRAEIENVRTQKYDDKAMVSRLYNAILKLAQDDLDGEQGGEYSK